LMIKGKTIICFASGYDAPPTSKHHVMHLLAEQNTVLWINYHASRTPSATTSDLMYMAAKLRQVASGLMNPRANVYVLTPLLLPLPGSPLARRLNRILVINQIRFALQKVQDGLTQIWSFTPDVSYMLGRFNEEKVVYYCVDDHASFTGYDRVQVLRDEKNLCSRADLVITTSLALQNAKSSWNPNTLFVPHGVDYDHFSRAVKEDLPCPDDIALIPKPRLGFFGLIRDWVDVGLLAEIAKKRTYWHFVLIGDADSSVNLNQYKSVPNMHFLGRRPYAELPAYCRHLDVGLIPFKVNELTYAVNPIKLREYLAAGLPVVSTPMPEVKIYEHLLELGNTPEGFEKAIEKALMFSESGKDIRSTAMTQETWPQKVELICKQIQVKGIS